MMNTEYKNPIILKSNCLAVYLPCHLIQFFSLFVQKSFLHSKLCLNEYATHDL